MGGGGGVANVVARSYAVLSAQAMSTWSHAPEVSLRVFSTQLSRIRNVRTINPDSLTAGPPRPVE